MVPKSGSDIYATIPSSLDMARLSGSEVFVEVLRQEGVDCIFANPGTTELPLLDAWSRRPGTRFVLALHEAAALSMADGYSRASGKVSMVGLHLSVGLGNAMGMLYCAHKAGTPLLVMSGQHDQSIALSEPSSWSDLSELAKPCVKWAAEVRRLGDLPTALHRAAKAARTPPTGPVFLSVPLDVLRARSMSALGAPTRIDARLRPPREAVLRAADVLARGQRPLLVIGDAVAGSEAMPEAVALAELLGAAVVSETVASRCGFPFHHPQYLGRLGFDAASIRRQLHGYDVLCAIGADLFTVYRASRDNPLPEGVSIIHIDSDPWKIGKNHPATAVWGDVKAALAALMGALRRRWPGGRHPAAARRHRRCRAEHERTLRSLRTRAQTGRNDAAIAPLMLLDRLAQTLPADAVVVDETVSWGAEVRRLFPCRDSGSFFGLRGGGIGWALPAAAGIKLARPSRPVVALVGDGSAMYSIQALWTAVKLGLHPLVYVIFNNRAYGFLGGRSYAGLETPPIDFCALARGLGAAAESIDRPAQIAPAVGRALAAGRPALIEAILR